MPKVTLKKADAAPKKAIEDKKEVAIKFNETFVAKVDELNERREARDELIEQHPDVKEIIDEVKVLEDEAQELLKEGKPIMAASGEKEIGGFKVQYPMSTPSYDGKKLLKLLMKMKDGCTTKDKADRFDVFMDLYDRGLLVELTVDAKVAGIVNERDAGLQKVIGGAWVESEALTPRVTVPKL